MHARGGGDETRVRTPLGARTPPAQRHRPRHPGRSGITAGLADAALDRPVLVIGSPPPAGRDLDLLVGPPEGSALALALTEAGFVGHGPEWVRWTSADDHLRADVVDLIPVSSWNLPESEERWLQDRAVALPGYRHLRRPAPAAALLILARRFGSSPGPPYERWIEKASDPLAEDRDAWTEAADHAPAWGAALALARLRELVTAGNAGSWWVRYALIREHQRRDPTGRSWPALRAARRATGPRPARAVVALSGLDGSGKSTQARLLVAALDDLGVPAVTAWSRVSYREWLWALERRVGVATGHLARVAGALRPAGRGGEAAAAEPSGAPSVRRPLRDLRLRHPLFSWAWAWVVALDVVIEQHRRLRASRRRVEVVVCDRYALDTAVGLRSMYGGATDVGPHARIVRRLLPRPRAAYLLRVDGPEAHRRKPEEHSVADLERHAGLYDEEASAHPPVRVLDGTRPVLEVAAVIADGVRAALHAGDGR